MPLRTATSTTSGTPTSPTASPAPNSGGDVPGRLLRSAATLSYDPERDIDWDAPVPGDPHGLNPEWSTLYGTPLWAEMSEQQRRTLTRHEVCSIMCTGIWFEMILQQMVLRDQYVKDPAGAQFRFALTEIADECRHSLMFARLCEALQVPYYRPPRLSVELGRVFKALAHDETAYAGILVAEEVLDVMQRDWMRSEQVHPLIRAGSRLHVVEESRHMAFARQEVRDRMAGAGRLRRWSSGVLVAAAAYFIVTSMINPGVYEAAGLDRRRAVREARDNDYRKAMMRASSASLLGFLGEAGLLSGASRAIYRRLDMV